MLQIKHILIKNYRSIVNLSLEANRMNVFVGLNDAGKSNVLKALNLFFNGKTELGHDFDFSIDYSNLAPVPIKRAKEITIQVTFSIPDNYKDHDDFVWKKIWRDEGLHLDGIKTYKFSRNSKLPTLLNRIKYKYVPAVKSNDYFRILLSDLYTSIALEVNSDLEQKAEAYSDALKTFTQRISDIVKSNTGIDSYLVMPTNQGDIFKELIFMTRDNKDSKVNLTFRGDGIKAMHIPAILKYISEQDSKILTNNSIPYTTIWGYEEPENGIEMLKCFEFAQQFSDFSKTIQMFISTHSPSFYCLSDKENAKISYVWKDEDSFETKIDGSVSNKDIDNSIGLMPIIAPYIREKQEEISKYRHIINQGILNDIDSIFVEGISDKKYLELAICEFSPQLKARLDQRELVIVTRTDGCGTELLCDWAIAWLHMGFTKKAYIVLDHDDAGKIALDTIKSAKDNYGRIKKFNIKVKFWNPNENILSVFNALEHAGVKYYQYELEHLLPLNFWANNIPQSWKEPKKPRELISMFESKHTISNTIEALIADLPVDEQIKGTILRTDIKAEKKMSLFNRVRDLYSSGDNSVLFGFKPTVEAIESYFLNTPQLHAP